MGSKDNNVKNNVFHNIISSSSNNNDTNRFNRGSYVEKSYKTCGKSTQKSGKYVKKISSYQAEQRADALISYFQAPNCREFFLKCIYHLTEEEINKAIENSGRPYVNSPVKYFNKACKQMMLKHGI